jgi:hypothetical protein
VLSNQQIDFGPTFEGISLPNFTRTNTSVSHTSFPGYSLAARIKVRYPTFSALA